MKTFKKTFIIHAEITDVYSALTNPVTIELWSGYPAVMDPVEGSEFSLWEGDISGKIVEIIENKKIVSLDSDFFNRSKCNGIVYF